MKIPDKGEEGANGKPPGDLYVSIEVPKDSYFVRDGEDIQVDIPITLTQVSDSN